ncbi:MAG: hypothetical protein ABWY64_13300 [Tardiphaga sp.]
MPTASPNRVVKGKRLVIDLGLADFDNPGGKSWLHPSVSGRKRETDALSGSFETKKGSWIKDPETGEFIGSGEGEGAGGDPAPGKVFFSKISGEPGKHYANWEELKSSLEGGLVTIEPTTVEEITKGTQAAIKTPPEGMKSVYVGGKLVGYASQMAAKPVPAPAPAYVPPPVGVAFVPTGQPDDSELVYANGKLLGTAVLTSEGVVFTNKETGATHTYETWASLESSAQMVSEVTAPPGAKAKTSLKLGGAMKTLAMHTEAIEPVKPKEVILEPYYTGSQGKNVMVEGLLVGTATVTSFETEYVPISGPIQHYKTEAELVKALGGVPKPTVEFTAAITQKGWTVTVEGKPVGTAQWSSSTGVLYTPNEGAEETYSTWGELKHKLEGGKPFVYEPHPTLQAAAAVPLATIPEAVVRTDGSEWNQETAIRLAKEYELVKPQVEASIAKVEGSTVSTDIGTWTDVSDSDQAKTENDWKEMTFAKELDWTVDDWRENNAKNEAMSLLAYEFTEDEEFGWAQDAIEEAEGEREKPYPFTVEQIMAAVSIVTDGEGSVDFEWDDDALDTPIGEDPAQQWLPGMTAPPPHERLTDDMRADIQKALSQKLEKTAEERVPDMDAPSYLEDQARENANEAWDELADEEKFAWGKSEGVFSTSGDYEGTVSMPSKPDPLNVRSDANYQATQRAAKALTIERAYTVMQERGTLTGAHDEAEIRLRIEEIDDQLWSGWVQSSTSEAGVMLQLIAADELGGRLNEERLESFGGRRGLIQIANKDYARIGGYDGLKAYIRGKWETTQVLLEEAGIDEVQIYRGLHITPTEHGPEVNHNGYRKLPEVEIVRNGLASFTTDASVANNWGSGAGKVVIRATVPRTAVLSVPAYGKNIHSEHEVIPAGTGWTGWDAWAGDAPSFDEVTMRLEVGTSEESAAWAERQKREQ